MSQPSAKEIAERILEPSEERNSLTWEQIQNLARAYLELEKEHEELKEIKFVIPTTYAIKLGKIGVFK